MENGAEKKENWKIWRWKIENWKHGRRKRYKMRRGLLFFFFFFFFSSFTFQNYSNLFWVYQNGNFQPGKSIPSREKNQEKWLCPLRKIFHLRPCIGIALLTWRLFKHRVFINIIYIYFKNKTNGYLCFFLEVIEVVIPHYRWHIEINRFSLSAFISIDLIWYYAHL